MIISPIHVIDLTSRLGQYAMQELGVEDISDKGYWREIHSQKLPINLALNWQRLGPGDTLEPIPRNSLAVALLVGPGSASIVNKVKAALETTGLEVWTLIAPSAIAEESFFTKEKVAPSVSVFKLPDSDPKTLWFFLLDLMVAAVVKVQSRNPATESISEGENLVPSNLKQSIDQAMTIDGAMAAALVDYRSGMCLAQAGTALNLDLAAAGNTQVVKAKLQTVESLGLRKGIEDILITLTDQYHLIRLVPNNQGLFLYLVLDKSKGNLALARYKLTDIERSLQV